MTIEAEYCGLEVVPSKHTDKQTPKFIMLFIKSVYLLSLKIQSSLNSSSIIIFFQLWHKNSEQIASKVVKFAQLIIKLLIYENSSNK